MQFERKGTYSQILRLWCYYSRRTDTAAPATFLYTVVEGDTLWNLARRFYGNNLRWYSIYASGAEAIGPIPGFLLIGTVLIMPAQ